MFKKIYLLFLFIFTTTTVSYAYDNDLQGLASYAKDFLGNTVLYLIFSFAIIFFLWNMLMLLKNPDKIKEKSSYIMYGILALTVMFTVYGLMKLVADTFGLSFSGEVPQFQDGGNK